MNKNWLYTRLIGIFMVLGISISQAEMDLRVSEQQLNNKLAQSFPITLEFQAVKTTFSQAVIVLNVLEQRVEIKTFISAKFNQQQVNAQALFSGDIEYDDITSVLMFTNLLVEQFYAPKEPDPQQATMLKIIQQSILPNLPDLPLIDLSSIDMRYPSKAPREISISTKNIMLLF